MQLRRWAKEEPTVYPFVLQTSADRKLFSYTKNNELYIQDGWRTNRRKLSYESLNQDGNIAQYVYVGS